MSEQQKDGNSSAPVDTNTALSPQKEPTALENAHPDIEAAKPKRRSGIKTKDAESAPEPAKPKRTRSSSRSAKAKNVLVKEGLDGAVAPGPKDAVDSLSLQLADGPPPLPPTPVVTPEGIAFMQQHVAYQHALEERSAWQSAKAERSARARSDTSPHIVREGDGGNDTGKQATSTFIDKVESGQAQAEKAASKGSKKNARQNSIEPGPGIQVAPIAPDLLPAEELAQAHTLRAVLERAHTLKRPSNDMVHGDLAESLVQLDLQALNAIKDAHARKLILDVVKDNLQAQPRYKAAFDRIAPEVAKEALAVDIGKAEPARFDEAVGEKTGEATALSTAVPESVLKKFLKVDSEYYFPDRSPAFVDRGVRLATRGEHPEVVVALIDIARERGWNSITVKGTASFRRSAWMEAARNGLQVAGYKPSELDLAQLRQREPANLIEPQAVREQKTGPLFSPAGPVKSEPDPAASEKSRSFANERPTLAVKKYPDLVQAYALLDAARKFAAQNMPGHEDQFVAIGKELIIQRIQHGKEVIGPKVHPDQVDRARSTEQTSPSRTESRAQPEVLARER